MVNKPIQSLTPDAVAHAAKITRRGEASRLIGTIVVLTQSAWHRGAAGLSVSYGAGRSGAATVLGRHRHRITLEHYSKHDQSATTENEKNETSSKCTNNLFFF